MKPPARVYGRCLVIDLRITHASSREADLIASAIERHTRDTFIAVDGVKLRSVRTVKYSVRKAKAKRRHIPW